DDAIIYKLVAARAAGRRAAPPMRLVYRFGIAGRCGGERWGAAREAVTRATRRVRDLAAAFDDVVMAQEAVDATVEHGRVIDGCTAREEGRVRGLDVAQSAGCSVERGGRDGHEPRAGRLTLREIGVTEEAGPVGAQRLLPALMDVAFAAPEPTFGAARMVGVP